MTTSTRVKVDALAVKAFLKEHKITPQIVMALAGYTEIGATGFNAMLRAGSVTQKVALVLDKLNVPYELNN
nr:hypothetical protein 4 [bacterium]